MKTKQSVMGFGRRHCRNRAVRDGVGWSQSERAVTGGVIMDAELVQSRQGSGGLKRQIQSTDLIQSKDSTKQFYIYIYNYHIHFFFLSQKININVG